MFQRREPRPRGPSVSTFAAGCVVGVVLLLGSAGSLPAIPCDQGYKHGPDRAAALQKKAEELRSTALQLVKKATFQDLTIALRQLRRSASLFRTAGSNTAAAADYLSIGEIYLIWSRYKEALKAYRFALALSRHADLDLQCSILSHIAIAYATFGDLEGSLRYSRQALATADRRASEGAKAEASEALGASILYSDLKRALELFQSAAETFRTLGDIDKEARATRYAGLALSQAGFLDAALTEQNRAKQLWASTGNIYGMAQTRAALGLLWIDLGEPDKALAEYQQARDAFNTIGDRDNEAIVLNGLGWVSEELGDYEESLRYYNQSRKIFTDLGDEFGEIGAIGGAAKAEWSLHRYAQARSLYLIKLKRAQQAGHYRVQASALSDLADVYEREQKYTQAERLYARARALCRSQRHSLLEAEILIRLGHLYAETSRNRAAIQSFNSALQLGQSMDRVVTQAEAHYQLAEVYRASQQFDQAKAEAESAVRVIESERVKVSDFGKRASYFASVHQFYQLYVDVLMQLHEQYPDQDFAQQAFEAAEKSKVRSLLDMLASSGKDSACDSSVRLPTIGSVVDAAQRSDSCTHSAPSALTLEQVQAEIRGDDAVLLEYALGPQSSQLWVVDEGQISSYSLPSETEISRLATGFRAALIARQTLPQDQDNAAGYAARVTHADKQIDNLSQELSQALLGPASHLLAKKRVIIVPDGALQYIPFAALPLPALNGAKSRQTLAEEHDVVSLPSASVLKALRETAGKRMQPTELAAVFADPVFSRDDPRIARHVPVNSEPRGNPVALGAALRDIQFGSGKIPRLPASRREAQKIANAFPDGDVYLAMDFDASRNTVLSTDLRRYRYIHFATHGILDSAHPEFSGLILSLVNQKGEPEEGYLRMRDIYSLKLSADLVVLSSCNSALGKDLESEGIIGLTRAFLYAGSQRVISTLWKVNDEATAQLMEHFYSRLHAGESPASALRGAQSDLAKDPQWQHPYYWAAFILQGEYR